MGLVGKRWVMRRLCKHVARHKGAYLPTYIYREPHLTTGLVLPAGCLALSSCWRPSTATLGRWRSAGGTWTGSGRAST